MTTSPSRLDAWITDEDPEVNVDEIPWKVLVVDDEADVHAVTRLALSRTRFNDRPLQLLDAYSAAEGMQMLEIHPDTALVFLDVVMETSDAGLRMVQSIRENLDNQMLRIVLRTGQAGLAPEREVILNYDINDYKSKSELTADRLYTTTIASLRAYKNLLIVEQSRSGLKKILDGSADLYRRQSLAEFASIILSQIATLIGQGTTSLLCIRSHNDQPDNLHVMGASGEFDYLTEQTSLDITSAPGKVIKQALVEKRSLFDHKDSVLYLRAQDQSEFVIYLTPTRPLNGVDKDLLNIFCQRISAAYDNQHHHEQWLKAQEATVIALADLAEFRDQDTGEHVLRVRQLTTEIAQGLAAKGLFCHDIDVDFLSAIGMASILHDVGKVATPDHILFKPGRHTPEERSIMEQHASIGGQILRRSASLLKGPSYLSLGADIALCHHEHYDGHGYPQQLHGEEIPLSARIVAVVDVFDALTHERPYKDAWPLADALLYIQERRGSQFDPQVIDVLFDIMQLRHPEVIANLSQIAVRRN